MCYWVVVWWKLIRMGNCVGWMYFWVVFILLVWCFLCKFRFNGFFWRILWVWIWIMVSWLRFLLMWFCLVGLLINISVCGMSICVFGCWWFIVIFVMIMGFCFCSLSVRLRRVIFGVILVLFMVEMMIVFMVKGVCIVVIVE